MNQQKKFQLSTEDARKINLLLPKGYKLITQQQFKKKAMLKPKKKTILGLPVTQQIVTQMSNRNINQTLSVPVNPPAQPPPLGRTTKNTKFMGIPSYESIPQNDFYVPVGKSYQRIPINLQLYRQPKQQVLSTPQVFKKLKNHPYIMQLDKVKPQQYSLSFQQIQKKVQTERDNYSVTQLIQDISKLCLKIYESYKRDSNEYQNTVSIEKYLKSLTKVQKQQTYTPPPTANTTLTRQTSTISQVKKKPVVRLNDMNATITIKQKRMLGQRIKKLPSQCLQQICYIIFQNLQNKQYSFDLDTLHIKKIRQLQDYVNNNYDYALNTLNQEQNKMNDEDDGEQSSFIIQGDGEEQQTNLYDSQF